MPNKNPSSLSLLTISVQVYLPAIEGHVLSEMVQALQALIEFIYIACCNIIDSNSLKALDKVLM
jgi:hypothetical protein